MIKKFINSIPRITKNLMLINLILFILTPFIPIEDFILMSGFGVTSEYFNIIQPLTSMFLHGSFSHLFFNMLMLWMFGKTLEMEMGSQRFLIFYLISGIGGWFLQGLYSPDIPAIGASGAIYGLFTAMGVFYPNQKINIFFLPFLSFKIKWVVGVLFTIEVITFIVGTQDGIAHLSHIGGGITGFLLSGFWLGKFSKKYIK